MCVLMWTVGTVGSESAFECFNLCSLVLTNGREQTSGATHCTWEEGGGGGIKYLCDLHRTAPGGQRKEQTEEGTYRTHDSAHKECSRDNR